jgi:hypothetical protein
LAESGGWEVEGTEWKEGETLTSQPGGVSVTSNPECHTLFRNMPDDSPDIVDYSTFVKDLTESKISDVDIYGYGTEIELTYKTEAGDLRATKGGFGLSKDSLLTKTLETHAVSFTVHAESYPVSKPWFDTMHIGSLIFF